MSIDRDLFFSRIRPRFPGGKLRQAQVEGMEEILSAWEAGPDADLRWLAYALATTRHETADTMRPISEYGGMGYFARMYDPQSTLPGRAAMAKRMGAKPGDGVIFYGRGYVQLTWRANYAKMGGKLGLELEHFPELALDPEIAAKIMFVGMRDGDFTGKSFGDYLNSQATDYHGARRIINGTDRADDVAAHAAQFAGALGIV